MKDYRVSWQVVIAYVHVPTKGIGRICKILYLTQNVIQISTFAGYQKNFKAFLLIKKYFLRNFNCLWILKSKTKFWKNNKWDLWSMSKPVTLSSWKERWQIKWDRIIRTTKDNKALPQKGRVRLDNTWAIGRWKMTRVNINAILIIWN